MNGRIPLSVLLITGLVITGCFKTQVKLFTDGTVPSSVYSSNGTVRGIHVGGHRR